MHYHNIMTIINPPNMATTSSNSSGSGGAAQYSPAPAASPGGLFFLPEVQMLELALAVTVFVTIHALRQGKKHGLAYWPVVGMLPSLFLGLQKDMYEWISGVLCRMNGTFIFRGPWFSNLNCVVTSDPRNLEYLLKTKFSNFPKGEYFRNTVQDLLGDGIFSADDEIWHSQRKTASLEFHSAKFRNLTTNSLLELVHSRLLPVMEESIKQSVPLDLQDVLLRLTFDNVCMIAFGVDPGCLRLGLPEIPFAQAFESATEATIMRFVVPTFIWRSMRYLCLGTERTLKLSLKKVDQFADEVIRTRKKELSLASDGSKQRSDLLTVFMGLKDEHGRPFSDKFLRDICVNFILAGRDTSSVALSWFFWLLNRKPEVEERILAEICQILNSRENGINTENEETLIFKPEEIKKMDYLQAALSEALRLYPSVPVDHKEVKSFNSQNLPFTVSNHKEITTFFHHFEITQSIKTFILGKKLD